MLEDLIQVAVGDALSQWQKRFGGTAEEQIQKMMGGSDMMSMLGPLLGGLGR